MSRRTVVDYQIHIEFNWLFHLKNILLNYGYQNNMKLNWIFPQLIFFQTTFLIILVRFHRRAHIARKIILLFLTHFPNVITFFLSRAAISLFLREQAKDCLHQKHLECLLKVYTCMPSQKFWWRTCISISTLDDIYTQ